MFADRTRVLEIGSGTGQHAACFPPALPTPASGLRDFHEIAALARRHGMELEEDHAMPANNRLLVFQKKLD